MDSFDAIKFFGALFAIMNPVTNLPVFLSITDGMTPAERRGTAVKVTLYALVLGGCFAAAGTALLSAFGISVNDFRVAGGLVVLTIGLGMLNGKDSAAHHGTNTEQARFDDRSAVAFYPLTFPILVGPGTITTLILYRQQATDLAGLSAYGAVFLTVLALVGVVFLAAGTIGKHISQTARTIMTRLMGMILAAIAVEMLTDGLKVLLPGLAG
ncbi:MarC family protein [Pseudooceanicola algae]|uniref:UPF0056 membrane protein n=1 Tax=Pseudooceanicola algae TaxID=1537215 RepID=A0A418SEX8_9RHOB|nr:MarC family protein [Pseudooceanicola algae]QPM89057.1 hypothetical protein PSAL_002660 [Pseudooceanicola algae]